MARLIGYKKQTQAKFVSKEVGLGEEDIYGFLDEDDRSSGGLM